MRIGHGFDAHRLMAGRPFILGGVTIPYPRGLAGHSDADVLTHAVMDALLGAAGMDDIGRLFPDSDPEWRGASSLLLLRRVGILLRENSYSVANVDCTVIAQEPRLDPYREEMKKNLAESLGILPLFVNVKFTTEERMGYTGLQEGLAAHAVALID